MIKQNEIHKFDKDSHLIVEESVEDQSIRENEYRKISLFRYANASEGNTKNEVLSLLTSLSQSSFLIDRSSLELCLWDIYVHPNSIDTLVKTDTLTRSFDFVLWPKGDNRPPKLLVFDMDSTFIKIEVIDELAKYHGVGESVAKVTEAAMQGELDFAESLITRVACLKGLPDSAINEIAAQLPLSEGVSDLVDGAHTNEIKIAIVSGGFSPFVGKLKKDMALYQVKANDLHIENGALSGRVASKIVDAQAKADFVLELKKSLGLNREHIMAIGDGANDLLMMKESGFSLAYRAKTTVQQQAKGVMNLTNLNHLLEVFNWHQ